MRLETISIAPVNSNIYSRPWQSAKKMLRIALFMTFIVCIVGCESDDNHSPVLETGTITDIEGNVYQTVRIGNQWWMAENLKVTSFRTGEIIPQVADKDSWRMMSTPAITTYNNLSGPGLLYNFHVITSGKEIAPEGWHVPSDEEWKILEEYLGMSSNEIDKTNWRGTSEGDALKVKSTNTSGWIRYEDIWGTNTAGFSAEGGSCRVFNGEWGIPGLWHSGFWWTSTEHKGYGYYRYLDYKKSGIFRYEAHPNYGFSIRCIKN